MSEYYVNIYFYHFTFYKNILISLFTSSILVLVVYALEYIVERRMALETLYKAGYEILNQYLKIKYFGDFDKLDDPKKLEKLKKILRTYSTLSKYEVNVLGDAYSNLDFLFGNRKLRMSIYNNIYQPIFNVHDQLLDASQVFDLYLNNEMNNINVVTTKLSEIQKKLFTSKITVFSDSYNQKIYRNHVDQVTIELELLRAKIYGVKPKFTEKRAIIFKYSGIKTM